MKKADLSLNLIIVAAILMIIFVVLVVIFSGRMGIFRGSVEKCMPLQGTCVKNPATQCAGEYSVVDSKYQCDADNDGKYNEGQNIDGVCCVTI